MNHEIIDNLSFEDYKKREGINCSLLKVIANKSLFHAKSYLDHSWEDVDSSALRFGGCFHSFLLEGLTTWQTTPLYYPAPEPKKTKKPSPNAIPEGTLIPWNNRAKWCQDWKNEQEEAGICIFSKEDDFALRGMAKVLRADKRINFTGRKELSLFVEKNGMTLKARLDLLPDNENDGVVDIKTCLCAKPEVFIPEAIKFGYHIQAAYYLDRLRDCGIVRDKFTIVACEKNFPYAHVVFDFKDEEGSLIRVGRRKYREALKKLVEAMETGIYPGYTNSGNLDDYTPDYMKSEMIKTIK